ncbi:MAG: protein kinase [Polyangia bacterium]
MRAALLVVLGLLCGCFDATHVQYVPKWTVTVGNLHEPIEVPTHLGMGLGNTPTPYELETVVELDPELRGKMVTLTIPLLRTPVELEVDGRRIPSLDEHLFDRLRVTAPHRWRIDARDTGAPLHIRLALRNVWSQSSWLDTVPRLSATAWGDPWTRTVRIVNVGAEWLSFVALLTIAVVFLFLHLVSRKTLKRCGEADKNAEIGHFALGASLFAACQLGLFQPFIGGRDVVYVLVGSLVAVRASIQLARGYVGLPSLHPWSRWALVGMSIVTPFLIVDYLPRGWEVALFCGLILALGYLFYATMRLRSAGGRSSELTWLTLGWVLIAVCGSVDLFTSFGYGAPLGGIQLTCASLVVVVTTQAYILSRDHERLLTTQATLNAELQQRVVEEGRLNEELRRKVGDRSRELSAALRKLSGEGQALLLPGTVLGDRYRISERLGAGAMGEVYRVERLDDGRSLAAKVIRGRVHPEALQRFTREAELAVSIDHPHVVRVLDVDVSSTGELFLIMELVHGASLEELRASYGQKDFALTVLRHVASALAAVHAGGVVHRDLKPSNVLVAPGPFAKVADFGIAGSIVDVPGLRPVEVRASDSTSETSGEALAMTMDAPPVSATPRLTQTGAIMGTPLYMAPEVLVGTGTAGPPVDLFAFGLIAYQLVGGPRLQVDPDARTIFRRAALKPFAEVAPWLSPALAELLERCVLPDPTSRPTAAELLVHLA